MLFRNCAGGVVFYANKVFILKNEKDEWVLPKGVIRSDELPWDKAQERVKIEAGIDSEIISTAGRTSYEFFSITRNKPVCNKITWYIMTSNSKKYMLNDKLEFKDGGFYSIDEALKMITYSQDKSLVSLSYKKYKDIMKEKSTANAV
ncbi:MAG: NUDIX hydrolase [Clostridiales bacterium]|nr:NUDIX hydrolase [Clostridiales bacterium]